jgi:cytochrome P450
MHQFEREARSLLRFVPRTVKTPGRRRFEHAVRTIDETVFGIIEAHRKGGGVEGTLLARLLAARDEEGNPMSDQQLRDEAVTLFLAGHETTALALTFALRLLARHPHVAAALRAELDRVLGGRAPTADDLPALPYADAVIRESMRLYPPAYAMGRETLQDMEIAGHFAPAGTQLVVSPWVVHRDPRWFPDPKRFAPERWLEGRAQGLHRFAYFPFGGGPRVCIGNHFAMLEAVIVLATLASRWAVEPVPGAPLRLLPSVTLRPIGEVPVRLRSLDGGPLAA